MSRHAVTSTKSQPCIGQHSVSDTAGRAVLKRSLPGHGMRVFDTQPRSQGCDTVAVPGALQFLKLVSGVQVYVQWGLTTLAALLTLAYSAVSSHVPYRPAASKHQKGEGEEPLLKHQHPAPCRLRLMVRGLQRIP